MKNKGQNISLSQTSKKFYAFPRIDIEFIYESTQRNAPEQKGSRVYTF